MAADDKLWMQMRAEYVRGGISYREIAEKFGKSFSQVKRRALTEKWFDLKCQAAEKATTQVVKDAGRELAKRQKKIMTAADRLVDAICEGINRGAFTSTTREIRELASALRELRDVQNIKSDADVREQEARIAKLLREARDDDAGNKEIRVIMSADVEALSK